MATEIEGLGEVPVDSSDPRLPLAAVRAAAPKIPDAGDREAFEALTATRRPTTRPPSCSATIRPRWPPGGPRASDRFARYLFRSPRLPARPAVEIIPPQDTFHRWQYYTEVNYEELRTATEAIYHEKPDLDWALVIYEYFEGTAREVDEAFDRFRVQYQDEVITDIKGIDLNQWTLLGDFKENRSKTTFYNKYTDVLKRILDRHAQDKALGQDLMRNRVRQLKAKNIRETGPDAPGLSTYKSQHASQSLSSMGAERVIGREEMARLERAKGDLRLAKELELYEQCCSTIKELSDTAKIRTLNPEEARRLREAQDDLGRPGR